MTDQDHHDLENIRRIRDGGTLKLVTADYVIWRHDYYTQEFSRRIIPVRCADCIYWQPNNDEEGDTSGRCRNDYAPCQNQQTDMMWFCADGERKEE